MSIEGGKATRLYHKFVCNCGYAVQAEDFLTIEKLANAHSRKCKQASVQSSQTMPFLVPAGDDE